jgi:hypothetical protein
MVVPESLPRDAEQALRALKRALLRGEMPGHEALALSGAAIALERVLGQRRR